MTMPRIADVSALRRKPLGRFMARWWPAMTWVGAMGVTDIALKAAGL